MAKSKKKAVLVTTEWKGVFFGYEVSRPGKPEERRIKLANARNAIRWWTTTGFLELASKGPNTKSKIGARAPDVVELWGVTSIAACSDEAVAQWEKC